MLAQSFLYRLASLLILAFAMFLSQPAVHLQAYQPAVQEPDAAANAQADAAQADDAKKSDSINEQTIYVPYDKLREVFERDGRGVFLPYDKFQELWNEARKRQPQPADTTAPLGALITDIESVASLGKEIVTVDAKLKIEMLRKGWHRVPLRLSDAAIRSAKIGDVEARIVSAADGSYELLIQHDADEPATLELDLSYAKALAKTRGQSTVSFQSPQAPVNRWTIRTGQKDVEVQIEPMIAASKKAADQPEDNDAAVADEMLAFVGAAPQVSIRWTPKAEGALGLAALISAETKQQLRVDEGVTRTSAEIVLDISRAEVTQLKLTVPGDQKVVNVFDRNVKKWDVAKDGENQTLTVELFEPALGRQTLSIELEKFLDQMETQPVAAPQIEVVDASRNQGVVLVVLASGLRAETATKSGLLQMDKAELPAELAQQDWRFAFRYASLPFELTLNVKKIQPLINVDQLVEVVLQPQELTADISLIYDIQQAGVFQLLLDIPKEFEIREIRGLVQADLAAAPVDSFYRDPTNENRWIVTLSNRAIGKVGLFVSLKRDLNDPNLLTPTGIASDLILTVPKAAAEGIEFSKGSLMIYSPESLQVNSTDTKGLRSESFENALSGKVSVVAGNSTVRPVLAYAFAQADASLTLQAKRRKPQVTVDQLLVITIQSGVVKYDARFFYDVRYSSVKSLRLDVPTPLVGELRNRSTNILQQTIEPQPEGIAAGYTAWNLTGENEFFGTHEVRYTWEQKIDELQLGASLDFDVPRLVPVGADRAGGQIVTTKSETIDLQPKSDAKGLRPIDPQTDLVAGTSVDSAAMAFEFVDEWSLTLTATRYELEDLKRTSIPRALIRVVALRQKDELSVQALYQIRSVDQRLAIQMPSGFDAATSFDDQPVHVNGRRVTPERGGQDLIYVPLTDQTADTPFLLELRYTITGNHQQIDLPIFPDDPAVQKVYLCVYLPNEQALWRKTGEWTYETIDTAVNGPGHSGQQTSGFAMPLTNRMFNLRDVDVDAYLNWVHAGVSCDANAARKFETDGRPYVFSSLDPAAPPDGSLHLRTMNRALLNAIACAAIGLLGLLFLRRGFSSQLAALLLLLVIIVLLGVFFPLVTEHLLGEAMLLTVGVVGLVWLVVDFKRWVQARQADRRLRRDAAAANPPAAATETSAAAPAEATAAQSTDTLVVTDEPPPSGDDNPTQT